MWIFAGYKKPLEKLFEHNEGLPSRFPLRFIFEDYTDDELKQIIKDMMIYMPPQIKSTKNDDQRDKQKKQKPYPSSGYTSAYPGGFPIRPPYIGDSKTCRYGLTWTFVKNLGWTDKYGNRTVDPDRVGTLSSKLVDENGDTWTNNDSEWKCSTGAVQDFYPSSPAPMKTTERTRRRTPFRCDEQNLEMTIKRLGRRRDDRGFGNARAVRVLFETIRNRQSLRISRERSLNMDPDIYFLTRDDLLGPEVNEDSLKKSQAWSELEQMEGIVPAKESVKQLFQLVLRNAKREERGEEPLAVSLNR